MSIVSVVSGELPGAVFEFRFFHGNPYHCAVLKATFAFGDDGRLELLDDQPPLVFGDQYRLDCAGADAADPVTTGDLFYQSDLTPYKTVTDVVVIGTARPPNGQPVPRWAAKIMCGPIDKTLVLTGPRAWRKGALQGWRLSEPSPTDGVSLLYSHAYGGRQRFDLAYAKHRPDMLDMRNPIGRGVLAAHEARPGTDYAAPQIEYPDHPVQDSPARAVPPAGFGPIPGHFMDRLQLSGTYDQAWQEKVAPNIPLDMNLRYWNGAPPDQQADPYLKGNEKLTLAHLLVKPLVEIKLPGLAAWAQIENEDGTQRVERMWLDTVRVDLDARHLILRWGWLTPFDDAIRRISLHCPRQKAWRATPEAA